MATNEKGSAMAITLLLITAAVLIGLTVSRKSTLDVMLAANDAAAKQAFYGAEGGSETGRELLEQNIACPNTGFKEGEQDFNTNIEVFQKKDNDKPEVKFWTWDYLKISLDKCTVQENKSITLTSSETSIAYSYERAKIPGASLLMAEGYEGFGYSAAKGGVFLVYDIWSQCLGAPNAEAVLTSQYQHMLGVEEECHY